MSEHRAQEFLERWRALERQLELARQEQRNLLVEEIEQVKREYAEVIEVIRQHDARPEPRTT